jgi:hypothetical protein
MNPILEFIGGAFEITRWLKDGGVVVDQKTAETRASFCQTCSKNVPVGKLKQFIAFLTRKILERKNRRKLTIPGRLGQCKDCGCVLNLLLLEEQKRIEPYLTDEERQRLPSFCWKIKKP